MTPFAGLYEEYFDDVPLKVGFASPPVVENAWTASAKGASDMLEAYIAVGFTREEAIQIFIGIVSTGLKERSK